MNEDRVHIESLLEITRKILNGISENRLFEDPEVIAKRIRDRREYEKLLDLAGEKLPDSKRKDTK